MTRGTGSAALAGAQPDRSRTCPTKIGMFSVCGQCVFVPRRPANRRPEVLVVQRSGKLAHSLQSRQRAPTLFRIHVQSVGPAQQHEIRLRCPCREM